MNRTFSRAGSYPAIQAIALILDLDPLDEVAQCRLVRGVSRHHLVGQRQAVRRHDQRDHHLNAIRPLVPAVAKASLADLRWVAFEIRAGQIVEQDFEVRPEQALPALLQEAEQLRLVRQQLVQAPI